MTRPHDDVFAQVEQRCPRVFPKGNGHTRPSDECVGRLCSHSDTSVSVNPLGYVTFKRMRAPTPTLLSPMREVRAGRFESDCDRALGRYVSPWARH